MSTPEEAKRAFQTARASMRRRKLKELSIAIALGLVCSLVIGVIIWLLNNRPKF
jgi:Mg/Co/Ni transporter MgtE